MCAMLDTRLYLLEWQQDDIHSQMYSRGGRAGWNNFVEQGC